MRLLDRFVDRDRAAEIVGGDDERAVQRVASFSVIELPRKRGCCRAGAK
jgi:hypothetical protein